MHVPPGQSRHPRRLQIDDALAKRGAVFVVELEPLLDAFMRRISAAWETAVPRLSAEALRLLHAYHWPGNVRELRNVIERAMVLSDGELITERELPPQMRRSMEPLPSAMRVPNLRTSVQAHELTLIREALNSCNGNQRKTAEKLGLPLRTLEHKLRLLRSRQSAL